MSQCAYCGEEITYEYPNGRIIRKCGCGEEDVTPVTYGEEASDTNSDDNDNYDDDD